MEIFQQISLSERSSPWWKDRLFWAFRWTQPNWVRLLRKLHAAKKGYGLDLSRKSGGYSSRLCGLRSWYSASFKNGWLDEEETAKRQNHVSLLVHSCLQVHDAKQRLGTEKYDTKAHKRNSGCANGEENWFSGSRRYESFLSLCGGFVEP